jgi:hypothetical protein
MKVLFIAVFAVAVSAITTIDGGIGQAAPQRGEHNIVDQRPIPATPDYNGGIEGQILLGPAVPVSREGVVNNRPYQATINVLDDEGRIVTEFQSDTNGRFSLSLKPGRYTLEPQKKDPVLRVARQIVAVSPDTFTQVNIVYDSGIR